MHREIKTLIQFKGLYGFRDVDERSIQHFRLSFLIHGII